MTDDNFARRAGDTMTTTLPDTEPAAPSRPPLLFSLSRFLIRHGVRGGWRLWRALLDRGALNRAVKYRLQGAARMTPLFVPLYRAESSVSAQEAAGYCAEVVKATLRRAAMLGAPIVLIDCGADIGLIASALIRNCAAIVELIAYEPNALSQRFLAASAALWGLPARIHPFAVGRRAMRGRLVQPDRDRSEHAAFIVEDPAGPVEVRRVDDDPVRADAAVVLKVDVEGAEFDVIDGAIETLRAAPAFVVVFEAHPAVAARCGVDPCSVIRLVQSVRDVEIEIAELKDVRIDPALPFFSQLGARRDTICNVVLSSAPAPAR